MDKHTAVFHQTLCPMQGLRDNRVANRGFDSAAHIYHIPTACSMVSTTSNITTHDLCIKSLEESHVATWEYFTKERTPAPNKTDPAALLGMELNAQCKLFDLIMKQNSDLLAAIAKGGGGGSGGGHHGRGRGGIGGRWQWQWWWGRQTRA